MTILMVPPDDVELWPTLGLAVAGWIQEFCVHGPGDLRGQRVRLDDEKRALLAKMYEVYPQDHPQAGRRRFRRCGLSLRKGSAKTEFAAMIAAAELHPDGPVRVKGWDGHGNPQGGGVTDPYIPLVAYTEEQSDELAYAALKTILEDGPLTRDFDIGQLRIVRRGGEGKAVSLASSPNARDGARTTFQLLDETHRWTSPRLRQAHRTMLANLPKRRLADPWSLEVTTAYVPGEGSVAEATADYARAVELGNRSDSRLFYFHREAADGHTLETPEDIRAAVLEASGPVAAWSDIDGIVEQWEDPTADTAYLERVWLNRAVKSATQAFDAAAWARLADPTHAVPDGAFIALGFDGSRYHDSTGIIATEIATGHQWVIGAWERPYGIEEWEVPEAEVDAAMAAAMEHYAVWRIYADPPYWETQLATWSGRYGHERVIAWETRRQLEMGKALRAYATDILAGGLAHSGDVRLGAHIGASCRRPTNLFDDKGEAYWTIVKDRENSPHKIDLAIAACLSWKARLDALAAGAKPPAGSIYQTRGMLVLGS